MNGGERKWVEERHRETDRKTHIRERMRETNRQIETTRDI